MTDSSIAWPDASRASAFSVWLHACAPPHCESAVQVKLLVVHFLPEQLPDLHCEPAVH